jgi:hypothetical protein
MPDRSVAAHARPARGPGFIMSLAVAASLVLPISPGPLAAQTPSARPGKSPLHLDVQERVLDNGVTVLVWERPSAGRIGARVFYRVDVAAERPGTAGLTHMLEHYLFMGSFRVGTSDWEAERPHAEAVEYRSGRSPTSGTGTPPASSSGTSSRRSRSTARTQGWTPFRRPWTRPSRSDALRERHRLRLDLPARGRDRTHRLDRPGLDEVRHRPSGVGPGALHVDGAEPGREPGVPLLRAGAGGGGGPDPAGPTTAPTAPSSGCSAP